MKDIKIFFLGMTSLLLLTSCQSNTYGEISVVENPTYTKNIEPVFKSQCTGCHKDGLQFPDLTTYEEVKTSVDLAPGDGGALCYIDNPAECFSSKIMPPTGRMPQTTIDMIKLWKTQGFQN